jgi:zinc/manganese transport system substrate-binding protein
VAVVGTAACGSSIPAAHAGTLRVVAAENFWGSITAQLGGSKAGVQSVVTDPNADPHEYETNTADARAFADADLVILNGAGYDDWGRKLLDANPNAGRKVLDVAQLLGKKAGDNPHFWYSPDYVARVVDEITATFKAIDPGDASYFDEERSAFAATLKPYTDRIAEIKSKYASTPIGATESIFAYMAASLGLNLISPPEYMDAVAEGNDPPAAEVIAFNNQITGKQIKVLVYNVQTVTAVTTNAKHLAAVNDIAVVGVSETLQPVSASFQDWQLAQLITLQNALAAAGNA